MMAGLLNKQQQQGQQGPQGGQPTTPPGGMPGVAGAGQPGDSQMAAGDEEQANVSPEEQAQYDTFVTNGMKLIYSEQATPQVLQSIAGDGNPIEGLGNALATVVMRLEDSSEKSGQEISGDVKFHGATELMEQLAELAEAAGIHEFTPEEMEAAYYYGLDVYRTTRQEQGKLDTDALQGDMQALMQAEQQGTLEEVAPGITEFAERAPKPEDAQAALHGGGQQQGGGQPPPRRG